MSIKVCVYLITHRQHMGIWELKYDVVIRSEENTFSLTEGSQIILYSQILLNIFSKRRP